MFESNVCSMPRSLSVWPSLLALTLHTSAQESRMKAMQRGALGHRESLLISCPCALPLLDTPWEQQEVSAKAFLFLLYTGKDQRKRTQTMKQIKARQTCVPSRQRPRQRRWQRLKLQFGFYGKQKQQQFYWCVQSLFPTSPGVSPNQPEHKLGFRVEADCWRWHHSQQSVFFYRDLQQTERDKRIITSRPLVDDGQTNPVQPPVRHHSPGTCVCAQWQTEWHTGIKVWKKAATGLVMSCVVRHSVH